MLEKLTKYKCKKCGNVLYVGRAFNRYYCCESCYNQDHLRKCLICSEMKIMRSKRGVFCSECVKHESNAHLNSLYNTFYTMLHRCYNPNRNKSQFYIEKGISVDIRWHDFENFVNDMGYPPDGFTLDRIDNSKGYCKNNCRWASQSEQKINRSRFKNTPRKYKGVSPHGLKWKSEIRFNGVNHYLGVFEVEDDAAIAYNVKVKEFYPETYENYINQIEVKNEGN